MNPDSAIGVSDLQRYADGWLMAGEIACHSGTTIANRRLILKNLFWWLCREEDASCSVSELRGFFVYMNRGHKDRGGRSGNPHQTDPVKPSTIATYQRALKAFFGFVVLEARTCWKRSG